MKKIYILGLIGVFLISLLILSNVFVKADPPETNYHKAYNSSTKTFSIRNDQSNLKQTKLTTLEKYLFYNLTWERQNETIFIEANINRTFYNFLKDAYQNPTLAKCNIIKTYVADEYPTVTCAQLSTILTDYIENGWKHYKDGIEMGLINVTKNHITIEVPNLQYLDKVRLGKHSLEFEYQNSTEVFNATLVTPLKNNVIDRGPGIFQEVAAFDFTSSIPINLNFVKQIEKYNLNKNNLTDYREIQYKLRTTHYDYLPQYQTNCLNRTINTNGTDGIEYFNCTETFIENLTREHYSYENFTGDYTNGTLSLWVDIQPGDNVEWIPTFEFDNEEFRVEEWAIWTDALSVDLEMYLTFDEGTGTTTTDIYQGKHNGTLANPNMHVWNLTEAVIGNASSFNGTVNSPAGGYFETKNSPGLFNISKVFTVSWWYFALDDNDNRAHFSGDGFGSTGASNPMFRFYDGSTVQCGPDSVGLRIHDGTGNQCHQCIEEVSAVGSWKHYIFVYNGDAIPSNMTIYMDGNLTAVDTENVGATLDGSENVNFTIGSAGGYYGKHGIIDELIIWNRALTAQEASDLYLGQKYDGIQYAPASSAPPPNVTIVSPTNITYGQDYVMFNITADGNNISNCFASTNSFSVNYTMGNDTATNFYYLNSSMPDGSYQVNFWCNDTAGEVNNTEGISFSVDATAPTITMDSPTNNTYLTAIIDLNVSADETISSWWYTNTSGAVNYTITPNVTKTWDEGSNTVTVYANDSYNNINSSTINFKVDTTAPTISNVKFYAINSSDDVIGVDENSFNFSNLEDIEKLRLNFSLNDLSNISGDINFYYTSNGSSACSLGNNQSSACYNFESNTWINFKNMTSTESFRYGGGSAQGDYINCTFDSTAGGRNYTCLLDEHYNPNVWKHYPFNFSDVKWQSGVNDRIKKNTIWKVELDFSNIPLDANEYKLDFRVNTTFGVTPTQQILAFLCNSSYTNGNPEILPECQLVAGKLPDELQDDGTKFRGIFTKNLVQNLGNIKYILIMSDTTGQKYYSMKTYMWLGSGSVRTSISTNDGGSYTNLSDGYESEVNINWFYNGTGNDNSTQFLFKIFSNDSLGNYGNSSIQTLTWITGVLDEMPVVDIITPLIDSNNSGTIEINWTTAEPEGDSYLTNVTASNSTDLVSIAIDLADTISNITWATTGVADGFWNITVKSCENITTPKLCGNDTHQIRIDNTKPLISITTPLNNTNTTDVNLDINYTAIDTNLNSCWYSNSSGQINYTLASCVNVTGKTWDEGKNVITLWTNDSVDNLNKTTITFFIDTTAPDVIINAPANKTFSNNIIDLNFSSTELGDCVYSFDDGLNNYTMSVNVSGLGFNATDTSLSDGSYKVTAFCNDTLGNLNNSITQGFSIDTTFPSFVILSPANNSNSSDANLEINFSVSDIRLDSCWWSNNSGSVNTTINCGTNITGKTWDEGSNSISLFSNDTNNYENSTYFVFTLDTTPPTFINFRNFTQAVNTTFSESITGTDAGVGVQAYSLNNTSSFVISNSGVITNVSSLGVAEIIYLNLTINDSVGNSVSGVFFINMTTDTTPPDVTINLPTATTYSNSAVNVNITLNENGYCLYTLDKGSTNYTLTSMGSKDFTNITNSLSNGGYTLIAYCNDTSGNSNYTENVTFAVSVSSNRKAGGTGSKVINLYDFEVIVEEFWLFGEEYIVNVLVKDKSGNLINPDIVYIEILEGAQYIDEDIIKVAKGNYTKSFKIFKEDGRDVITLNITVRQYPKIMQKTKIIRVSPFASVEDLKTSLVNKAEKLPDQINTVLWGLEQNHIVIFMIIAFIALVILILIWYTISKKR